MPSSEEARQRSATALSDSVPAGGFAAGKLFDVRGWVCVVTGGTTGLGLVTTRVLAENGARVYITGRRGDVLRAAAEGVNANTSAKGGEVRTVEADMADKAGIEKLRDALQAAGEGRVHLVVLNHGVSLGRPALAGVEQTPEAISREMFDNETFERWAETYAINTASYYFCAFALLPLLAKAEGSVLIVSSMSGITNTSQRGQFAYNASKAATLSLNAQLATEFARRDLRVRVNALCPGYFASGMSVVDPSKPKPAQHYRTAWAIPAGRTGGATDYAQAVLSTATNAYMTGAEVVVDGGWLLDSQVTTF